MRLKHVWIQKYKNLKDFTVKFDGANGLDVVAGLNGSGKSNLFEAILHIFSFLYRGLSYSLDFDFNITYELNGIEYTIVCDDYHDVAINGEHVSEISDTILPINIAVAYSGHNVTINKIANELKFDINMPSLTEEIETTKYLLNFDYEFADIYFALLLPSLSEAERRKLLLGEVSAPRALRVKYVRPILANDESYNINDAEDDKYWKQSASIRYMLDFFETECGYKFDDNIERQIGYSPPTYDEFPYDDYYIYYYDLQKIIKNIPQHLTLFDIATFFIDLRSSKMLDEFSILPQEAMGSASPAHESLALSDGQMQKIFTNYIINAYKNTDSLVLFDEPDAFMHPLWQAEMLPSITNDGSVPKSHYIFSTHSPTTLTKIVSDNIIMISCDSDGITCQKLSKIDAIHKLSSSLIRHVGDQQLIDVLRYDGIPLLFVEGLTDVYILTCAWEKLFGDEQMPFCVYPVFGYSYLSTVLQGDDIRKILGYDKPIFGLFDFDSAFSQWNGINKKGDILGFALPLMVKKHKDYESYAIMVPVPLNNEIQKQVFKKNNFNCVDDTFKDKSCCSIEHLFYGNDKTKKYFQKHAAPGGGKLVHFVGCKMKFSTEVVPTLAQCAFEIFRPMFDFIKSKCI